ncbi:hypothetical protein JQC67_10935 [Aurantibacter crassamenti]|uniref:DUF6452 family protein n=1 Tax=Aurantibacter crassamenti TaxID=1837375 RepID=UPI00193A5771|nr:DUF6452 family protein [Aurantibacter crassamenti]MBM1106654.1 hypothetical protein [Aurantibacter crassamenti]
MKRIALFIIIFSGIIFFSGCEKDDICIDAATPQLVVRFYDFFDTTSLKEVSELKVQGFIGDSVYAVITNVSTTEIKLPLRSDTIATSFIITRNLDPEDETTADIDTLVLNYELNEIFKSRACGYVMSFENITGTISTENNWMKGIEIITDTLIVTDTIANVKIFH